MTKDENVVLQDVHRAWAALTSGEGTYPHVAQASEKMFG